MSHLLPIVLSLIGLAVSTYIFVIKQKKQSLYCFLGHDCSAVVNSKYSKTFSLPNEAMGIIYYLVFSIIYLSPLKFVPEVDLAAFIVSALATGFSFYLVYIQAWVLHKWCEWCLLSTICSTGIFLILLF